MYVVCGSPSSDSYCGLLRHIKARRLRHRRGGRTQDTTALLGLASFRAKPVNLHVCPNFPCFFPKLPYISTRRRAGGCLLTQSAPPSPDLSSAPQRLAAPRKEGSRPTTKVSTCRSRHVHQDPGTCIKTPHVPIPAREPRTLTCRSRHVRPRTVGWSLTTSAARESTIICVRAPGPSF